MRSLMEQVRHIYQSEGEFTFEKDVLGPESRVGQKFCQTDLKWSPLHEESRDMKKFLKIERLMLIQSRFRLLRYPYGYLAVPKMIYMRLILEENMMTQRPYYFGHKWIWIKRGFWSNAGLSGRGRGTRMFNNFVHPMDRFRRRSVILFSSGRTDGTPMDRRADRQMVRFNGHSLLGNRTWQHN